MLMRLLAPGKQENKDNVQEILDELKQTHSNNYTAMQLRIWAEMINSGLHVSMDEAPNTSMFHRAGQGTTPRKKDQTVQMLADVATTIVTALSPKVASGTGSSGSSPARVIEHRSKRYKQLNELQDLHGSGVLNEDEYDHTEKASILGLLHQLGAK